MQVGYRLAYRSEGGVTGPFESFQAGNIAAGPKTLRKRERVLSSRQYSPGPKTVRKCESEYFRAGSIAQGRRHSESVRCGQLGPVGRTVTE